MHVIIKINMDNAAFEDNGRGPETCDILAQAQRLIFEHDTGEGTAWVGFSQKLRDTYGNTVGTLEILGG